MTDDFKMISEFLAEFQVEVGGRRAVPLTDEERAELERFARGGAADSLTKAMEVLLAENSIATEYFAQLLLARGDESDSD